MTFNPMPYHNTTYKWFSAYNKMNEEVCQILGQALGYPWFKDDQKNFPDAGPEHGVCVGEHVAETIAAEAAKVITELKAKAEQQDRTIKIVMEARDYFQARAETLEQKLVIVEAEIESRIGRP